MKKVFVKIAVFCFAAVLALGACLSFAGCTPGTDNSGGNGGQGGTGEHVHSYTEQSVPATCQKKAHTLYVCSCGDSYEDDFTGELAAHTGSVRCSVCGLDYFEALAGYIEKRGELDDSRYVVDLSTGTGAVLLVMYSPSTNKVSIGTGVSADGMSSVMSVTIGDTEGRYSWLMTIRTSSTTWTMAGTVSASSFTPATGSLTETLGNVPAALKATSRELAASQLKTCVIGLKTVLLLEGSGVTAANFGFTSFVD